MAIDEVDLHAIVELLVHNLFSVEMHVVIALHNTASLCDPFAIALNVATGSRATRRATRSKSCDLDLNILGRC
jgi:hypothetical protein